MHERASRQAVGEQEAVSTQRPTVPGRSPHPERFGSWSLLTTTVVPKTAAVFLHESPGLCVRVSLCECVVLTAISK